MNHTYLTQQFQGGPATAVQLRADDGLKSVHDVILFAAEHRLRLSMLCREWHEQALREEYSKQTGETFAESLRRPLERGSDVRVLIWSKARPGIIFPEAEQLLRDFPSAKSPEDGRGQLTIRVSGMSDHSDELLQFVCAHPEHADTPCAIRLGAPRSVVEEGKTLEAYHARHGITYVGEPGIEVVRKSLEIFDSLFGEKGPAEHSDSKRSRIDIRKLISKDEARARAS